MLEVRHLRTIAALADTGNLTRAAKRVHLSGSALSHQLKLIEDRYGELYLRKSQPLRLTAVGRRLLRLARVVDEAVAETERDLSLLQGGRSGDLRVAVECHSCFDWLMPAMDEFREVWETVELDLVSGFHPDPLGLLGERRADLVIVSRQDGRPGLTYHPLFRFQMLALVPNTHDYAGKRFLTAKDFASETLVTYPIPDDRLDVVREVLAPAGVDPPAGQPTSPSPSCSWSPASAGWPCCPAGRSSPTWRGVMSRGGRSARRGCGATSTPPPPPGPGASTTCARSSRPCAR